MAWSKLPLIPEGVDNTPLTPRVNEIESKITNNENRINNDVEPKINKALTDLSQVNRQSTTISEGVSVVTSSQGVLADVEIQGRTLTSLANSNLQAGKNYVLSDKKTKVIVDNKTVSGVGKFVKASTTATTADFVGKVSGSTVANPHMVRYEDNLQRLSLPTDTTLSEHSNNGYSYTGSLNGIYLTRTTLSPSGYSQNLFSFNIVEQIERQLGLIPKSTLAEKVQWVKDNIDSTYTKWFGYGSSPAGNKSSLSRWSGGAWVTALSHTSDVVTMINYGLTTSQVSAALQADGFMHFLAYAEPSNGAIASTINTDHIIMEITLKSTAQLNTRAKIIRVENLEGKIVGSTVENPHIAKRVGNQTTLQTPVGQWSEFTQSDTYGYGRADKLDGSLAFQSSASNGGIAQQLFSFNLIESIERNIGKIPAANAAGKVAWLKSSLKTFTANWYGYGSGAVGNSAKLEVWYAETSQWQSQLGFGSSNHGLGSVSKLPLNPSSISNKIDDAGFVHFLAYANPSDGVTPSAIYTDYIELEIELKPDANFSAPKVPLYEVTTDSYNNIAVTWTEAETLRRYPVVEGTQHIMNPYVVAEGENLLPPFSEWVPQGNFKIESLYKMIMNSSVVGQQMIYPLNVFPSTTYTLSIGEAGDRLVYLVGIRADGTSFNLPTLLTSATSLTFTTPSDISILRVIPSSIAASIGKDVIISNLTLTLGTTAKPFVPRNPSYLYAEAKLGAIGTTADVLFKQDGKWKVRKSVEKDIVLDGSLSWGNYNAYNKAGFMGVTASAIKESLYYHPNVVVNDFRGEITRRQSIPLWTTGDEYTLGVNNTNVYLAILNDKTGFVDSMTPTPDNWKRYFNGWKYTNGTTWTSVTGNGQTATAQVALDTKPTDYTPYKLSYVLATPVVEEVRVEGDIKLSGATQVEVSSGIIVREKVVPSLSAGVYRINNTGFTTTLLKNRSNNIVGVFKNGAPDPLWTIERNTTLGNGGCRAFIAEANFSLTSEYTVTYVSEKSKLTSAPTNVKLTYANSARSALDDLIRQAEDNSTSISVNGRLIVDILARLKAQGI